MKSWSSRSRGRIAVILALGLLAAVGAAVVSAGPAPKPIKGTERDDTLRGTSRSDVIWGLGGADRLIGYRGNDRLFGHRGGDRLLGGAGADVLVGGAGRDRLEGGPGNDRINARDGAADSISCGPGTDTVLKDVVDTVSADCSDVAPPPVGNNNLILVEQGWECRGKVDYDLVRVTLRTTVNDAIRLGQQCSGRVGRIEVETWTADGIKILNAGEVAHDLVIESGYVKCHAIFGDYHQDGIQAMGGHRLTFKNLRIDCLGNSNIFLSRGGSQSSTPTDIVCDGCVFGPNSGQTVFYAPSLRSGVHNSTICTGRFRAIRVEPGAEQLINSNNKILPRNHASCRDVTGRGGSSTP
jgi:hypothetical protein